MERAVAEEAVESWLADHGLTRADFEAWNIKTSPTEIRIPVYSMAGTFQFMMVRQLTSTPKFIMQPDGARQNAVLYGIHRAAPYIHKSKTAILTEGFADVLALHSIGSTNTVCAISSLVTDLQIAQLELLAARIIVFGDGDEAGDDMIRLAAKKTKLPLIGVQIRGMDPCEVVAHDSDLAIKALYLAAEHIGTCHMITLDIEGNVTEILLRESSQPAFA